MTEPDEKENLIRSARLDVMAMFIRGTCHEINNPLTGILGYTQLALGSLDAADPVREDLKEVEACAIRVRDLIEKLSATVREQDLEVRQVPLDDLVSDALNYLEYYILRSGIEVQRTSGDAPPVRVRMGEMRHTVASLLLTAVRSQESAGGHMTLHTGGQDGGTTFNVIYTNAAMGQTQLSWQAARHVAERYGGRFTTRAEDGRVELNLWLPA